MSRAEHALAVLFGFFAAAMYIAIMLAVLAVVGCSAPVLDEPTDIVWTRVYRQSPVTVPDVVFLDDGKTFTWMENEYYGLYWDSVNVVYVGRGPCPLSQTAFAHELLHAAMWISDGIEDPKHERPEWKYLVPAANAWLASLGY